MRTWLKEMLATFDAAHDQRSGDLWDGRASRIGLSVAARENIDCEGFIHGNPRESFLARPVSAPAKVSGWQFDRVLITDEFAESGVSREKVLRLGLAE